MGNNNDSPECTKKLTNYFIYNDNCFEKTCLNYFHNESNKICIKDCENYIFYNDTEKYCYSNCINNNLYSLVKNNINLCVEECPLNASYYYLMKKSKI